MYNLDVNFLNDRPDLKPGGAGAVARAGAGGRARSGFSSNNESKMPLYAGIATLVGVLGLTAAAFGYYTWHRGNLADQQAELDTKLGTLEAKRNELTAAKKKVADAEGEIKALASVFTQIKPWSAISQDIRDRLPEGVQIVGINQAPGQQGSAAATGPDAVYTRSLILKGKANNFEQVNNFLVVLQKSSFLKADSTKIVTADREASKTLQLASLPNPIPTPASTNATAAAPKPIAPAPLIGFTIQTELTDVSSAELRKELERKGAVGLMSRFDALKSKGVKP
jgi:type IV pilus assembly protein PilN